MTNEESEMYRLERKKTILGSKCFTNIENRTSAYYFVNGREIIYYNRTKAQAIDEFGEKVKDIIESSESVYMIVNPTQDILYIEDGKKYLNSYKSPESVYGLDVSITNMDDLYNRFFNHLFPNPEHRTYALDWIASSLVRKNQTFLTMVGAQGIGKNVLSYIINYLHLKINTCSIDDSHFKSNFNKELLGKTFILFDEVKIQSIQDESKLKRYINPTLRIESKGMDSEEREIFFSLMMCSNSESLLRLSESDRRYSLMDTTEIPLIDVFSQQEIHMLINKNNVNPEGIRRLYHYFRNRQITTNQEQSIRGDMAARIMEAGSSEWERIIVNHLKDTKMVMTGAEVKEYLEKHYQGKQPPIYKVSQRLRERHKKTIACKNSGNKPSFQYIGA